jgi:hypothetical protein
VDGVKGQLRILIFLPEPDEDLLGLSIDAGHHGHLLSLFDYISLVDANTVNPERFRFGLASEAEERISKIVGNKESAPVASDWGNEAATAPGV